MMTKYIDIYDDDQVTFSREFLSPWPTETLFPTGTWLPRQGQVGRQLKTNLHRYSLPGLFTSYCISYMYSPSQMSSKRSSCPGQNPLLKKHG